MLFNAVHSVIYRLQAVIENEGCHIEQGLTKLRGVLQTSCCLKKSDCCLPPTPVCFLEDSGRFYELLSPILLLLSLIVLQLHTPLFLRSEICNCGSCSILPCSPAVRYVTAVVAAYSPVPPQWDM
ncbi:hypothetical protein LAZ67_17000609 [Cordylochernes scorpioides]|uniref:Uncharacterized protein n=1 Tax=Cordylochernes scorpioides TaxID=51811 RepID=A0ABY6LCV3_9ARAC|nr:hypothetical protein LAZ67_17000609 [Cordylochernes scorpioides]